MTLSAFDRLRAMLRPPGKGIFTFSTGGGYAAHLHRTLYGTDSPKEVQTAWEDTLQRIRRVKVLVLGIPSDTGAGIMRGSNFGPIGIREAFFHHYGGYPKHVVDVGDVLCVPQLLHDEMLSESQIAATRRELYPGLTESLPVSPLSMAEWVLNTLSELNPDARVVVLGGDHSVSWPSMTNLFSRYRNDFGVLHFDAHTDLMDSRVGIKYCFATWAYHALRGLKPHALVQVGIRTSSKTKEQWHEALPVKQIWAREVVGRDDAVIQEVIEHFQNLGLKRIFISNDIDGTDSSAAPATGTPETDGLTPQFVKKLLNAIGTTFELVGADIVEVAPPLSGIRNFSEEATCHLASEYLNSVINI